MCCVSSASSFDALIFGYHDGDKLIYVAKTRNGFTPATRGGRDVREEDQQGQRFHGFEEVRSRYRTTAARCSVIRWSKKRCVSSGG